MLELRQITKAYTTASLTQTALDGVSVAFRDNEFVAVLGQSGSGKTTMLNVIGGLDHFDDGDLLIDGVSTKDYSDRDWDAYRNNRIGFVFQAYNLIPHQSVLANVELALTLSGVSAAERKERATAALTEVGLADHLHKKPSQMSGGQMQRVAIARALVNDPEILLADEPTGALDSATSVQVMDLLREVASDRLVVMVTHNPELAAKYATRTVELADGQIISDTDPFDPATAAKRRAKEARKTAMGLGTALSLSFNNLMTKKGRTIMTAFAGSIGIIGIAAILALANGVNDYIAQTEEEALTSYPLTIQKVGMDMTSMMANGPGGPGASGDATGDGGDGASDGGADGASDAAGDGAGEGRVQATSEFTALMNATRTNDLHALKSFFDADGGGVQDHVAAIEYHYDVTPQIFQGDTSEAVVQVNPDQAFAGTSQGPAGNPFASFASMDSFQQMPVDESLYRDQYEVQTGRWADKADELVIVLGSSGRLPDVLEYTLGLRDHRELEDYMRASQAGSAPAGGAGSAGEGSGEDGSAGTLSTENEDGSAGATYTYAQLMDAPLTLVQAQDLYQRDENYGVWTDRRDDETYMRQAIAQGQPLKIVGIVQAIDDDKMTLRRGIAYTPALTTQVMNDAAGSDIVQQQRDNPDVDVFTGRTFEELASGDAAAEFDMSSLFSIDTQRLQAAFQIDPAQMQLSLDTLDLSGIALPDLDAMEMDLTALDPAALDPSAFDPGALDLSGLDPAAVNLDELTAQYPQLADVDFAQIIATSLSDGAVQPTAGEYLSGTVATLVQDYFAFAQEQAAQAPDEDGDGTPDVDTGALVGQYLALPQVQATIDEALNSDQVFDQDKLTANLTAALGEDPGIAEISAAVREQLVTQISTQVGAAVGQAVQQSIGASLQATMQSAMTQMMGSLQQQIQAQLQGAMTNFADTMASAMRIDPSTFADAFSFDMDPEQLSALLSTMLSTSSSTYEGNLTALGFAETDDPSQIDIYPTSFEDKDAVISILDTYNTDAQDRGEDEKVIVYTDLVGLLMSSVTSIIDVITWMLIAFVSISLVVSSIMIAIITYISVLERRKEIGILRSIGASKRSISHVFNAETFLEGLMAGLLGVAVTWLLTIPANAIVADRFDVERIAVLPIGAAIALVAISVVLTVLAGLLPAAKAAREDPVEALRSE